MITINYIKEKNKQTGHYFFSRKTMRFFASRVVPRSVKYADSDKVYFITSEKQCFDDHTRVFNVRRFNDNTGDILTMEGNFSTLREARQKLDDAYQADVVKWAKKQEVTKV